MDYDLTGVSAYSIPDVSGQTRRATGELRFMHGRLQQAWETIDYGRDGRPVDRRLTWRDVPDATPAPRADGDGNG